MSIRMFTLALLVGVTAFTPKPSHADASALAYVQLEGALTPTPNPIVGPISSTMSAGSTSGAQYALAASDLSSGVLRVVGTSGDFFPRISTTNAAASFTESVSFSGGFGQTAFLDYVFEGSLTSIGSPQFAASFVQLTTVVNSVFASVLRYETLSGYIGNCGANTNCEVGQSTSRTVSLPFTITSQPMTFISSLSGFASFGNSFDFGNSARYFVRAPDGVTFTSTNGFLSTATPVLSPPVSPIPEPETYALMAAGLLALHRALAWKRRSKGQL